MKKILLSVAFTFLFINSKSQEGEAVKLFNEYYKLSIEELRALYNVRGAIFKCEPVPDPFESIKSFLEVYGENKSKIGLIFYSLDSLELRIWLIRNDSLYFSVQSASRQSLKNIEMNIRNALQVDMLQQTDNESQRGLILKESSRKKSDLQAVIKEATAVLLPERIAENLRGLQHLILITEYNIGQIPFYILKPYQNDAYLVDSVSISLAPHLCNLGNIASMNRREMGRPNKLFAQDALVVGNPAYAKTPGFSLTRLPGAEEEAITIHKWTKGTLLTDSDATISLVKEYARKADLLYFATHGYSDVEKVLDGSWLAFAPDTSSSTGQWTARQIQSENFDRLHMMAVLSACQTGVGKVYDAGFIGLGRAFFKAGVDHTIMSLWSVNDIATRDLMKLFFREMIDNELDFYPASHLRKAILKLKEKQSNPALWSPFILFGFPY